MRHTGRVEVIAGSMFSGKTEELIRRVRRAQLGRQPVQAFKPVTDDRYDKSRIVSHGDVSVVGQYQSQSIDAVPVESSQEIPGLLRAVTKVVAIDEAQFFDAGIVKVVNRLADEGRRVIVAGLDQDFRGEPFGPMPQLMAVAEDVRKVRAVCTKCGADACRSQRVTGGDAQVQVGGENAYEARCRACYKG
jgi:thymidine kinase